jgi:hypothetical protein
MSKSKKMNNVVEEYSDLKDQLLSNVQQLGDCYNELSGVINSVFNSVSEPSELNAIKQEWVDSSSKIDKIDDSIKSLTKEKTDIIKKIEAIVNKKGKTTSAQNKNLSSLRDEWVEVSNQISVLHEQLETYNKDRAKLIKKTETYFSKLDASEEVKPKKGSKSGSKKTSSKKVAKKDSKVVEAKKTSAKKTSAKKTAVKKTSAKKTPAKKASEKKSSAKATAKKETVKKTPAKKESVKKSSAKVTAKKKSKKDKDDEEEEESATTNQVKLTLDSDSDSETSESDTDSDLSSIESGDSDSDSDSSSSEDEE